MRSEIAEGPLGPAFGSIDILGTSAAPAYQMGRRDPGSLSLVRSWLLWDLSEELTGGSNGSDGSDGSNHSRKSFGNIRTLARLADTLNHARNSIYPPDGPKSC